MSIDRKLKFQHFARNETDLAKKILLSFRIIPDNCSSVDVKRDREVFLNEGPLLQLKD